jgi:hypothetical protein
VGAGGDGAEGSRGPLPVILPVELRVRASTGPARESA